MFVERDEQIAPHPSIDGLIGIFEWGLLYKETAISAKERDSRSHNSMPFRSPTHAGGLFAIDRLWFQELGYYDEGLQIWGGEQYELSFKVCSWSNSTSLLTTHYFDIRHEAPLR
ncbi:unnamed protein product [Strongylus vulgaris]|uniref:Galactosyltransferase C-terminal domain-containing protein n=1 Tax=Strongylus vulgaris TaxID=40348 RepID=A0A3P7JJ90_STRVU|nr:unnamed protein product [Strongylus vulgaris]